MVSLHYLNFDRPLSVFFLLQLWDFSTYKIYTSYPEETFIVVLKLWMPVIAKVVAMAT